MKTINKDVLTGIEFKPSNRFVKLVRIEIDKVRKLIIQWVEL